MEGIGRDASGSIKNTDYNKQRESEEKRAS